MPTYAILGGGGDIGREVVRRVGARGATALVAGRDAERLTSAAAQAPGSKTAQLDATDFAAVERCLADARQLGNGRLDGIALCVGSILLKPARATSEAEWHAVLATNLTTAFAVVRAAPKVLQEGGSVVFCSSVAATIGLANHEAIAAAKAGVEGLSRAAAASNAPRGIRFNVVAPGLVRTRLASTITGNERALQASERMHPLGRIASPDEVAAAIDWLLSDQSAFTTGQVLHVDGGLSRVRALERSPG